MPTTSEMSAEAAAAKGVIFLLNEAQAIAAIENVKMAVYVRRRYGGEGRIPLQIVAAANIPAISVLTTRISSAAM
mgnify:CR=1 FL=1